MRAQVAPRALSCRIRATCWKSSSSRPSAVLSMAAREEGCSGRGATADVDDRGGLGLEDDLAGGVPEGGHRRAVLAAADLVDRRFCVIAVMGDRRGPDE